MLKFAGGIRVPDDLFTTFQMEYVTDHRWGLWVQPQEYAVHPKLKRKLTLKQNPAYNRAAEAAKLKTELERTKRRFQSPVRSQSPSNVVQKDSLTMKVDAGRRKPLRLLQPQGDGGANYYQNMHRQRSWPPLMVLH